MGDLDKKNASMVIWMVGVVAFVVFVLPLMEIIFLCFGNFYGTIVSTVFCLFIFGIILKIIKDANKNKQNKSVVKN